MPRAAGAIALLLFVAGCSSPAVSPSFDDAGGAEASTASDGGATGPDVATRADAPTDSGPLGMACSPAAPCVTGYTCFGEHTSPTWGCDGITGCLPDLFGHCYVPCTGDLVLDCVTLGGHCGSIELVDGGEIPGSLACVKAQP